MNFASERIHYIQIEDCEFGATIYEIKGPKLNPNTGESKISSSATHFETNSFSSAG